LYLKYKVLTFLLINKSFLGDFAVLEVGVFSSKFELLFVKMNPYDGITCFLECFQKSVFTKKMCCPNC